MCLPASLRIPTASVRVSLMMGSWNSAALACLTRSLSVPSVRSTLGAAGELSGFSGGAATGCSAGLGSEPGCFFGLAAGASLGFFSVAAVLGGLAIGVALPPQPAAATIVTKMEHITPSARLFQKPENQIM